MSSVHQCRCTFHCLSVRSADKNRRAGIRFVIKEEKWFIAAFPPFSNLIKTQRQNNEAGVFSCMHASNMYTYIQKVYTTRICWHFLVSRNRSHYESLRCVTTRGHDQAEPSCAWDSQGKPSSEGRCSGMIRASSPPSPFKRNVRWGWISGWERNIKNKAMLSLLSLHKLYIKL